MEFDKSRPIYLQIKREVKERIVRGEIKEEVPTVRSLAMELGVNPNTVAKAYREMEREDIIGSWVGRGTWVKDGARERLCPDMIKEIVDEFIHRLVSLGLSLDEIKKLVEGVND